jgi:sulfur carrier protein
MERICRSLRDDKQKEDAADEGLVTITVNGQARRLEVLEGPVALGLVVEALGLKADRVAVECNGEIAPRAEWGSVQVTEGDRLEIVHFVGGG